MASITEQIVSLATALGATASGNYTISSAIDLLADTLAGSDQSQQATIAAALGELSGKIAKVPSGTISITENGENIDVSAYAAADVSVSGGGATTEDVWLWNTTEGEGSDVVPTKVEYISGYSNGEAVYTELTIESATTTWGSATLHGVKASGVPVGAYLSPTWPDGAENYMYQVGYSTSIANVPTEVSFDLMALMPIDGYIVSITYDSMK